MKSLSDPLVSVVIITYNHAPFIAEAIQSVLDQKTSFSFEVLVGEDGSNDGTREIVCDFESRYPGIVKAILHKREDVVYCNGKPAGGFNFFDTISRTKGRYIAYLDGDDFWIDKNKLEAQFSILESRPELSLCGHWVINVDKYGKYTNRSSCTGKDTDIEFGIISALSATPVHPNSWFFRRLDFTNHSFYHSLLRIAAGDDAVSLIILNQGRGYCIPKAMSAYRLHNEGIWSGRDRLNKLFVALQLGLSQPKLVNKKYLPFIAWKNSERLLFFIFEFVKTLIIRNRVGLDTFWYMYKNQEIVSPKSLLPWLPFFIFFGPIHIFLRIFKTKCYLNLKLGNKL